MKSMGVIVLTLPGLDHVLAEAPDRGVTLLDALHARVQERAPGARLEGERIVATVEGPLLLSVALGWVTEPVRIDGLEQGAAAAVGLGPVWRPEGEVLGPLAAQVRRLALLARPQEVLCPDPLQATLPLPEGVGVHRAPAALNRLMGVPVHVLRDYR